jgi:hypothetical protein
VIREAQTEEAGVQQIGFEIVPHPRYRGDCLLKPTRGAPFGLWYRDRAYAVSYAEWVAREVDSAEIRVFNRDGTLAESRVVGRSGSRENDRGQAGRKGSVLRFIQPCPRARSVRSAQPDQHTGA